jgi:hypothetical protein
VIILQALTQALNEIKFMIPMQILQKAFLDISYLGYNNYSIDDAIVNNVLRAKVLPDCNMLGGQTMVIDVSQCGVNPIEVGSNVITVPKHLTGGRSIVSVISVVHVTQGMLAALSAGGPGVTNSVMGNSGCCDSNNGSPVTTALTNLYNSGNNLPVISSAVAEIIGENIVHVRNLPIGVKVGMGMICVVANDENMSNIQPRSVYDFKKLCVLACKAYIYNKLLVNTDIGEFKAGASLGVIKSIIESYSDAAQMYDDFLRQKWVKIAYTNDKFKYSRLIARTTGQRG